MAVTSLHGTQHHESAPRNPYARSLLYVVCLVSLSVLPTLAAQNEPGFDSVYIGAFDADAWNGVVFEAKAKGQRLPFALRIGSKSDTFLDGSRIFNAVSIVGPHAPDGSYSLLGWRHSPRAADITLEWSRVDRITVVGRIKAPSDVQLVLETYSPDSPYFTGAYHVRSSTSQIDGEHFIDGVFGSAVRFTVAVDRPAVGGATFSDVTQLQKVMDAAQLVNAAAEPAGASTGPQVQDGTRYPSGAAGLQFVTSRDSTARFVATIGWDSAEMAARTHDFMAAGRIDAILDQKARQYDHRRPHIEGLFAGAPEPIGNSMFWNSLYVPALALEFPSISRNWAHGFGGWVVGEWDCFLGSLLTNVEDAKQTSASVRAILLAQAPNGVVPNVDAASGTSPDRSQPPIGSFIVLKNYERSADLELLKWAYPRLKKWHEWWFADRGDGQSWRDGNHNGLLEWGSDRGSTFSVGGRGALQQAKWESGMDDSPMYDDAKYNTRSYTMELDDVGLNSLYALDSECLARIADIVGEHRDSRRFTADYERVRRLMREQLWNEQDGIYESRFWDGHFLRRLSPTNFYPLLAGIATPEQANRMVQEHLLNPREFWGEYVIPTISRTDPAFRDQYYWRGDIWGPTNYLVYEGLNRYRRDDVALQFAEKSYNLFMNDWRTHQRTNEQYYAWGGSAGGDVHYTWGALLCLIPMEQFIDESPWDGLRFGALEPSVEGQLRGVEWNGHHFDVTTGPKRTSVTRDGRLRFEANTGLVVREYKIDPRGLSFSVHTPRDARLATMETTAKVVSLRIDSGSVQRIATQHGTLEFTLPAGEHRIAEVW